MTSRSKLSRREREARTKLIQEHHLNKDCQKSLDKTARTGKKYTEIRANVMHGAFYLFMIPEVEKRMRESFTKIGESANGVSAAFSRLALQIAAPWIYAD